MHIDSMRPSDFDGEINGENELTIGSQPTAPDAFQSSEYPSLSDGSDDDMDDVFAVSRPGSAAGGFTSGTTVHELSELPRLQREHATNGYRDGVTAAKATSIQAGFDEGFSLGATFGAVAGRLLGVLEGVEEALTGEEKGGVKTMLEQARKELSVERIFAAEYWNGDGTWKYGVQMADGKEEDLVFDDVVREHPLVKSWWKKVDVVMNKWMLTWTIPGREGDEGRIEEEEKTEKKLPVRNVAPATTSKNPLDW
ncbi:hypothetical protein TD95_003099 [Thielaviopsis punctulata]|uniref:Protein YAE1 n=1 Tax=Thielaviopsis punctulata TaxID=72032 RepID=A0A0F4ZIW3_9PEZI|nr:hypothetical protein TD95_003099 [Thielaviopsis punctulata]